MKLEPLIPLFLTIASVIPHRFQQSSERKKQPFFILGSGRNGSTLLGAMLASHSKLGVLPEQFALGYSAIKFKLRPKASWNTQVNAAIQMFSNQELSHWGSFDKHTCIKELLEIDAPQRSFQTIIDTIYRCYLNDQGECYERWGDKSPKNTLMLDHIYPAFPKAKYIFLVRDGRDVVRSYVKGGEKHFGQFGKLNNAVWRWNMSIDKWHWLKQRTDKEQRLNVKYEKLISDPKQELFRICEFLNVEFELTMLNYSTNNALLVKDDPVHRNLQKPLLTGQIGKWKEFFSLEQVDLLNRKMSGGLNEWGY